MPQTQAWFLFGEDGAFRVGPLPLGLASATLDPMHALQKEVTWETGPGEHALGTITLDPGRTIDVKVIDGAVNGAASIVEGSAAMLRRLQSGSVRAYAGSLFVGVVVILGYYLWR